MKRVIILLAFCAFQTVFAFFREFMDNLHESSMKEIKRIILGLSGDVKTAIEDGRSRGLNEHVEKCWDEFRILADYYASVKTTVFYDDCYTRSFRYPIPFAYEYAEGCYRSNIHELVINERKCRSEAKKCVQKHFDEFIGPIRGERAPIAL